MSPEAEIEIVQSYALERGKSLSIHAAFLEPAPNLEKVRRMITDSRASDALTAGSSLGQSRAVLQFYSYDNQQRVFGFHYDDLGENFADLLTKPFNEHKINKS